MENKTPTQILRSAPIRATTPELLENRQVEFVISSEAVDTFGTVFRAEGAALSRYKSNPIVLYSHARGEDPDNVLGTGEVFREGNDHIGRVTFEPADLNPKAEKIFRKVQAGTLRMASIGADPTEAHWGKKEAGEDPEVLYFDRWHLMEFSIVPVGSNPDALKRNAQSIQDIKDSYTKEIRVADPQTVTQNEQKPKLRNAQTLIYKYSK